jgi:hypothetical protein
MSDETKKELPNHEEALSTINKALADIYGVSNLKLKNLNFEIDKDHWKQVAEDGWTGNVYHYSF